MSDTWPSQPSEGDSLPAHQGLPSTPPPVTATPGWYRDPQGRVEERYWDGTQWTSAVRPLTGGAMLPAETSPKSRLAALLLAIFLGSFGVHSFYVGKTGVGIGQIAITVISLGTLGWIWPLVDIIMIAVGSYRDGQGRPVLDWQA